MTRINVRPENLEQLSAQIQQVAAEMEILDGRLGSSLRALDWSVGQKPHVEQRAAAGHQQCVQLLSKAAAMSQFLAQKARAFAAADGAGLNLFRGAPGSVGAPAVGDGAGVVDGGGSQGGAPVAAPGGIDPNAFVAASDQERFAMVRPHLLELEQKTGVPWQVQAAQWALESGWGKYRPTDIDSGRDSFNMFGIKGEGPAGSVNSWTTEEVDGEKVRVVAKFRAYNSLEESLEDHARLLTREHYQRAMACGNNLECWAEALGPKVCGYATSSEYPASLMRIMKEEGWV